MTMSSSGGGGGTGGSNWTTDSLQVNTQGITQLCQEF